MSLLSLDLQILLDFLRSKDDDCGTAKQIISAQRASLETISSMCSNSETVNCLRELGGINLIWNLCCKTESLQITHSCLFALACVAQNNVFAQQDLCLRHVFESLNCLLSSSDVSLKTKTLATYFLLSIVSKNKQGQTMILKSNCLGSLMVLFTESSQVLSDTFFEQNERMELFKIITKVLSYSANVPQNVENQDKLCEILPWIIGGVHSGQKYFEIGRLSCELLTAVIEDNKTCQLKTLQHCGVEALILLINSVLRTSDEDCLGSAIVALNHVLTDECEEEHWKKFASFFGSLILLKLIAKVPSEKWMVYHINQTLMLLAKCIENCNHDIFDCNFCSTISKSLIKLMKIIPDDEYFHKMAVCVLDFVLELNPTKPDKFPAASTSLPATKSKDFLKATISSPVAKSPKDKVWYYDGGMWGASKKKNITPISMSQFSSAVKHRAYTKILVRRKKNGKPEITLDISQSSKEALKSSSGIQDSPTENVFPYPPSVSVIEKGQYAQFDSIFKKPKPLTCNDMKRRFTKSSGQLPFGKNRHNSSFQRRLNTSSSSSIIRYSTPKAKKVGLKKFFLDEPQIHNASFDDDIISVCGDLIEREATQSARKRCGLKRFGSSGLLIGQNYKCI